MPYLMPRAMGGQLHAESLLPLPLVIQQIQQVMFLLTLQAMLLPTLPEVLLLGLAFQLFAELLRSLTVTLLILPVMVWPTFPVACLWHPRWRRASLALMQQP